MEDAHASVLTLKQHPHCGFFGIYDGHNGTLTSRWCAEHVHNHIDQLQTFEHPLIQVRLESLFRHLIFFFAGTFT